ncbi:hypothetical protein [Chondromyces apiculatus]|uniref:hypothetical protein n=1 Tax=Chondromyces apiculatus TaxID=51 RepID=UPI0012DE8DAE|nr:hypothetical protein [Chondromyces apiculatus]
MADGPAEGAGDAVGAERAGVVADGVASVAGVAAGADGTGEGAPEAQARWTSKSRSAGT